MTEPHRRPHGQDQRLRKAEQLLNKALGTLNGVRVFTTSKERIKHPEGDEWFDEQCQEISDFLEKSGEPVDMVED